MPDAVEPTSLARTHAMLSLAMLLVVGATCFATDFAAHSKTVCDSIDRVTESRHRSINQPFVRSAYRDPSEELMLSEVPRANHAAPGAYFFGSSNLIFAADFSSLPSDERATTHDYGFPGASVNEMLLFVRFLVDHRGFLANRAGDTGVFICLTPADLRGNGGYFTSYIPDSTFFRFDADNNLQDVPMSPLMHFIRLRRLQCTGFVQRLLRMFETGPFRERNPEAFRRDTQRDIRASTGVTTSQRMAELSTLLDYLNNHGAAVTLVLLPRGSWEDSLAFDQAVTTDAQQLCDAKHVRLVDQRKLLRDDEFFDAHHPTFDAQQKERDALLALAREHLSRVSASEAQHAH